MADYCKFIPGDGKTKSLIVSGSGVNSNGGRTTQQSSTTSIVNSNGGRTTQQSSTTISGGNNYSGDDFYRDLPNYDDVDVLIRSYRDSAIIDIAGGIDKDQLQVITKDLNNYVKKETARIDRAVDDIINGKIKPSKNSTGLSTTYDDLWNQQLVYDAKNPYPARGLQVPITNDRTHWGGKYPFLYDRLITNPNISGAECDKFLRDYGFDRNEFSDSLKSGILDPEGTDLLGLLNDFYRLGAFSSTAVGMFCSMVPDIFEQVNQLMDVFNSAKAKAQDIMHFLAQPIAIQWKLAEAAVKAMLNQLKEHILSFVDQMTQAAIQTVYNMTGGWLDPNYIFNNGALSEKYVNVKDKALNFFSKENIENIKEKISGGIDYAAGVFERMDIEEIQFLIMRFCELLQNIEQMFFGVTSEMSDMIQNYQAVYSLLRGSGDLATAQALAAGAIRFDAQSRYAGISDASNVPAFGPVSSSPYAMPGSIVPEDARGVPAGVRPITPEEISEVPSYEQICSGSNPYIRFQNNKLTMGSLGWTMARVEEKVMLMRLAKVIGSPLTINCAYRSPENNSNTRGAAKNSLHMSGKAFDISTRSGVFPETQDTLINIARSVGFSGFGRYATFVHIDTGRPRTWNG